MPIYAYKCESCGHAKDVLQKISDALLTDCPQCGASAFRKQVTAAGFQLKGSGWYVTDFRGGNTAATPPANAADGSVGQASPTSSGGDSKPDSSTPAATPPAAASAAPAPAAPATTSTASTTSSTSTAKPS